MKELWKYITIPMFELENDGSIKPNFLFHRPLDKVHSRCIEYPYAASKLNPSDRKILHVGIAKADKNWIRWLESLPLQVYGTDYDKPIWNSDKICFDQFDVRKLAYDNDFFDLVFAVSVIEHIGLENSQVNAKNKPRVEANGDLQAVREIARVLRAGGRLVMTLPFGLDDGLILGGEARNYTKESIRKFESILRLEEINYYEYLPAKTSVSRGQDTDVRGLATWRKIPPGKTQARHKWHTEGIVCGVWKKA